MCWMIHADSQFRYVEQGPSCVTAPCRATSDHAKLGLSLLLEYSRQPGACVDESLRTLAANVWVATAIRGIRIGRLCFSPHARLVMVCIHVYTSRLSPSHASQPVHLLPYAPTSIGGFGASTCASGLSMPAVGSADVRSMWWIPLLSIRMQLKSNLTTIPTY